MLKIERHKIIETEITKHGFVLVPALSKILGCSEETVRRDIKQLEKEGKLIRTHGGAYLLEKYDKSYPTELRRSYLSKTKKRLAGLALKQIKENDVIMLDSSTTCLAVAEAIVESNLNLSIITNSLAICSLCNEKNTNVNLICPGGTFRRRTSSFADPNTVVALKRFYADKAIISCPKVSMEYGLSDNHQSEAAVREQMLKQAHESILIVDHTKFGANANILFEGLEKIGTIITDSKLPPEWEEFLKGKNIALEYCAEA